MKFNVYQVNTTGAAVSTKPTVVHLAGFNNMSDANNFVNEKVKGLGNVLMILAVEGELKDCLWGVR